jgi:hypothetical protein
MKTKHLSRALGAALLLTAIAATSAPAAGPADVTFRAEGTDRTLVPRTAIRTTTTPVNKTGQAGQECSGTSALGALEQGTGGDWSGPYFTGLGYSVAVIKGERHDWSADTYWHLIHNRRHSDLGPCALELSQGDSVLYLPQTTQLGPLRAPLWLSVPARVTPGTPFTVTVTETAMETDSSYTTTSWEQAASGVTVSGGGASAVTDAQGRATLTLAGRGAADLQATGPNRIRSAIERTCATDGADGFCGTSTTQGEVKEQAPTPSPGEGPRVTTVPPRAVVTGIAEGRRFTRSTAPRRLQGAIRTSAGLRSAPGEVLELHSVKLRLTRNDRGRCSYFSGRSERFRANRGRRCGAAHGYWFAIGDKAEWSYLLPSRLPRGRYVLDVNAIDRAYRRDDARRRGENRIVFHVR